MEESVLRERIESQILLVETELGTLKELTEQYTKQRYHPKINFKRSKQCKEVIKNEL